MEDLNIRQILESVKSGQLRVPAFQRGFVWDADKVAFLMDSIFKNYPIGSLLLWNTKERLTYEKSLGPFTLPSPAVDYPVNYILDGQQRITSIFGVFQADIPINEEADWMNIYYDLQANPDIQESQFVALSSNEAVSKRYFPLRTFFDTVAYRRSTRELDDALADQVDKIQTVFKEARIPVQQITTENRTTVAIVFERVNQRGVPLDTLQLLTAWTWSQDFHLQTQFEELAAELEPFGFEDVGEDKNLLLRCCSAVVAHNPSTQALMNLNGALVRGRFQEVINGLKGAIDFLQSNLNIFSLSYLPFSSMLIPLTVFFSAPGNEQVRYNNEQRQTILDWFWRVCFTKRYNSQTIKSLHADVLEMEKLKFKQNSELGSFVSPVITSSYFKKELFRSGNVNTRTFLLMLAQEQPKSFVTGSPIRLAEVLKDYNRNEFHHLYPRAFVKNQEKIIHNVNCLANFCFISRSDNNFLGGDAPSIYRVKMPPDVSQILEHSFCSDTLFEDNFEKFIEERAVRLAKRANELMSRPEKSTPLSLF